AHGVLFGRGAQRAADQMCRRCRACAERGGTHLSGQGELIPDVRGGAIPPSSGPLRKRRQTPAFLKPLKYHILITAAQRRQTPAKTLIFGLSLVIPGRWKEEGAGPKMTGIVQHKRLESRTARARLKRGRQPHWQDIVPGRVHLGYQIWKGDAEGRWILRRY